MMKKKNIVIIAVVAVVLVLIFSVIGGYNGLVDMREGVESAASTIDTQLQRRADLIPNLVSTVKGYVAHENEVIDKVTTARQNLVNAKGIDEKQKANDELTSSLNALMVIVENYPDLKSSENFRSLQDELAGTENRIATARKDYNDAVKNYNLKIKRFPGNIMAGMFNFGEKQYFQASEGSKEVPVVDFSK